MSKAVDCTKLKREHYTVIRKALPHEHKPAKNTFWICLCECGNYFVTHTSLITADSCTGCGCVKSRKISEAQREILTGQRFGSLVVVSLAEISKNRQCKWHCKCDCGQEVDVYASNLKRNHTRSCGCERSVGEKTICDILASKNIKVSRQYIIDDLKGIGGGNLMFDFAFFDIDGSLLALLEYQGIQHYKYTPETAYFGYQQREHTDKAKKNYCKAHGIPLYEIRYDESIETRVEEILYDIFMAIPC